jgi:antirestriction protein ArdC
VTRLHPPRRLTYVVQRNEASTERRPERGEQLHTLLIESVEAIQSSEDWKRLLTFASRFHHYSLDNQLLIAVQHERAYRTGRVPEPLPSYVAGFHTWKTLGRSVNKGQRGYGILAPIASRRPQTPDPDDDAATQRDCEHPADGEEATRSAPTLRGFAVVHVWDISQTSGAPIPEAPEPQLLRGAAPPGMRAQLTELLQQRGFAVCTVPDAAAIGGANGLTDFRTHTVQVRADMDDAAQVKTLAHETGHVLLHDPATSSDLVALATQHRGQAEVEAESVAYIVTSACGMDPSSYSLPYVTSWAGTREPAEVVRATARRVIGAAQHVLHSLDITITPGGRPPAVSHTMERSALLPPVVASPFGSASPAIGI